MRVLVISDTHKRIQHIFDLLEGDHRFDRIFHLGDLVRDAQDIESLFNIPIDYVAGNCDWGEINTPTEKVVFVQGKKILLTHGHHYFVKNGTNMLKALAKKEKYDIILYGHTHMAHEEYEGKCLIINPGSISSPRDGAASFGVLTIDEDGKIHTNIARIS